jgi:hypothetical protein
MGRLAATPRRHPGMARYELRFDCFHVGRAEDRLASRAPRRAAYRASSARTVSWSSVSPSSSAARPILMDALGFVAVRFLATSSNRRRGESLVVLRPSTSRKARTSRPSERRTRAISSWRSTTPRSRRSTPVKPSTPACLRSGSAWRRSPAARSRSRAASGPVTSCLLAVAGCLPALARREAPVRLSHVGRVVARFRCTVTSLGRAVALLGRVIPLVNRQAPPRQNFPTTVPAKASAPAFSQWRRRIRYARSRRRLWISAWLRMASWSSSRATTASLFQTPGCTTRSL